MPGDIALDLAYRMELQQQALTGFPGAVTATLKELNEEVVNSAETRSLSWMSLRISSK